MMGFFVGLLIGALGTLVLIRLAWWRTAYLWLEEQTVNSILRRCTRYVRTCSVSGDCRDCPKGSTCLAHDIAEILGTTIPEANLKEGR